MPKHPGPSAFFAARCYQRTTTARTSRAESTRYSSAPNFTSVPPYLLYSTRSPTATSSGTRLPLSSMRPGPTATTSPSWGFSFAVSGMTRPLAVVVSASTCWMTMRSSSGLMETDTVASFFSVFGVPPGGPDDRSSLGARLALGQHECQSRPARRVRIRARAGRTMVETGAMDAEELRLLLSTDGLALLERTEAGLDDRSDVVREVSRLRAEGHD